MKKNIIYTITGICIILAATTLVTSKNTTDKANAAYVTQMKKSESQYVLSAKSTEKSYTCMFVKMRAMLCIFRTERQTK